MVRTQVQLTDEQAVLVKRLAAARHLSMAEVIRQAVDVVIKTNTSADYEEKKIKALAAVGKFRSGKHDISKEHDKYLADAFGK